MKKYRFLSLLLAGFMALTLVAPALALEDPQPQAKAVIIVDGDNREVLYDFHAHERRYPASITKIMTSLVVLDAVDAGEISLDTVVTASAQAVDLPWDSSTAACSTATCCPPATTPATFWPRPWAGRRRSLWPG